MPSLVRGRVVYSRIAIPDPQGQNPKPGRPFVVISPQTEIKKGDSVLAVGITSELHSSPADHYVHLPYGPTAKTGLKGQSAVLCTWLIEISPEKLEIARGYVHPDLVDQIVMKLIQLKSLPHVAQDDQQA